MPVDSTRTLLAGRYRTIERVGSGGMAVVLLAEDERLGREVAIKRLHAESPETTAERFRREARLGASLNHPNVVAVYDIVTDDEGVLIVMEYVEGETLRDAIERGPLEPGRALEVLRGLAAALDHAHGEGIVHRDVKPANVLLGKDGRTKLADLGIATAVEGTRLTMSGTVLGTAAYMAPEQLEGHKPGPSTDVYSLAVVAWETLSGRRAYEGRTPLEIAHRKSSDPPPFLSDVWPAAPAAAAEVLARAMGPDPAGRPATATALVDELERAFEEPVPERAPAKAPAATAPTAKAPRTRDPLSVAPPSRPAPGYARHNAHRGRPSWLVPLVVLLAVLAVGAIAVATLGGGGSSSNQPKQSSASAKAKKHSSSKKSGSQPAAQQQAPAPPSAAPAQTQPSTYQVPQPSGSDAAAGQRLNAKGKALSDAGNYKGAIPVLEDAVKSFPAGTGADDIQYAYALFNLGHALRLGGRPADAVPVLEERLKNPDQQSTVQSELDAARAAAGSG
jgi:serine/threonine-protein kinase